jgi:hypothetical protein
MIDADGDPETEGDQSFPAGWSFNLDTDATITQSEDETAGGEDGFAWFVLELGEATDATVTEDLQDGFELVDAFCVDLGELPEQETLQGQFDRNAFGDFVGELEGDAVTFTVNPSNVYGCLFVNTPIPEDSVGGETATPKVTLPPTDTFGGPQAPSNESWRIMLVVMAGILASALILTPSPATRRK